MEHNSNWHTRFLMALATAASAGTWLVGSARADAGPVAAAASPQLYATGGNASMELGIHLFVGAVLFATAVCLVWLLWLMLTSPPEDEDQVPAPHKASPGLPADPAASLLRVWPGAPALLGGSNGDGLGRILTRLVRHWIGVRLGHPGPL